VLKAHFPGTLELARETREYKKFPLEICVKAMEHLDLEDFLTLKV
jgi:hypothetical protein